MRRREGASDEITYGVLAGQFSIEVPRRDRNRPSDIATDVLVHDDARVPDPPPLLQLRPGEHINTCPPPLLGCLVHTQVLSHRDRHPHVDPCLSHGSDAYFSVAQKQEGLTGPDTWR